MKEIRSDRKCHDVKMSRYKWNYKFNLLGWNTINCFLSNVYMIILLASCIDSIPFTNTILNMQRKENSSVANVFVDYFGNYSNGAYTNSAAYEMLTSTTEPSWLDLDKHNVTGKSIRYTHELIHNKGHDSSRFDGNDDIITALSVPEKSYHFGITLKEIVKAAKISRTNDTIIYGKDQHTENISVQIQEYKNGCICNNQCKSETKDAMGDVISKFGFSKSVNHLQQTTPTIFEGSFASLNYSVRMPESRTMAKSNTYHLQVKLTDVEKYTIHIGGLFELTGSRGDNLGLSELIAAKLAVDTINRVDFLKGYKLKLLHNDTTVSTGIVKN